MLRKCDNTLLLSGSTHQALHLRASARGTPESVTAHRHVAHAQSTLLSGTKLRLLLRRQDLPRDARWAVGGLVAALP